MAEREGFEPPVELPPRRISSAVHSTTLPPLREMFRPPKGWSGRHGRAYGIALGDLQQPWPVMLFVYGTLRDPQLLSAVLGRPATGLNAAAPGYAAVHYPGRIYPALVRRPGSAAAFTAEGQVRVTETATHSIVSINTAGSARGHETSCPPRGLWAKSARSGTTP